MAAERGLIKGFIDLTFEHDNRLYWLDWKSDKLSTFTPESLEAHTHENYGIQARIYASSV